MRFEVLGSKGDWRAGVVRAAGVRLDGSREVRRWPVGGVLAEVVRRCRMGLAGEVGRGWLEGGEGEGGDDEGGMEAEGGW